MEHSNHTASRYCIVHWTYATILHMNKTDRRFKIYMPLLSLILWTIIFVIEIGRL